MELQQLQHFLVLARVGNIGRAAEELHITHSGLSHSIRTLEDFLAVRLFVRNSRGVTMTPFGHALLPRATHILNERGRAISELEALRALRTGHAQIALDPVFDDTVVAQVIDGFLTRFPEIQIDLWSGVDPELSQRVMSGNFDFAFTLFSEDRNEPMLVHEPLLELPVYIYAREGYALAQTAAFGEALRDAEWVLLGTTPFQRAFYAHLRVNGAQAPRRVLQCRSMALLRSMVERRGCLTLLPALIGDQDGSGLRRVQSPIPVGDMTAGLVYRNDTFHSLPTFSLLETFRQVAEVIRGNSCS